LWAGKELHIYKYMLFNEILEMYLEERLFYWV
jgi:hypothetical protein